MDEPISSKPRVPLLTVYLKALTITSLVVLTLNVLLMIFEPRPYQSIARLRIEPGTAPISELNDPQSISIAYKSNLVTREVHAIQSASVLSAVIADLDLKSVWEKRYASDRNLSLQDSIRRLNRSLMVGHWRTSNIVEIHAFDENPEQAARIANSLMAVYMSNAAQEPERLHVQVVESAQPPSGRTWTALPREIINTVRWSMGLGATTGAVACGLVLWRRKFPARKWVDPPERTWAPKPMQKRF